MRQPDTLKLASAVILSAAFLGSGSPALGQPAAYCDAQAREFANSYNSAGQNIAGGAVASASAGAALAGAGNGKRKSVGRGALIAAAAGAAAATDTAARWQQDYNYAYQRCMAATDRRRAPPAGTPAWQDYCSARYRSFDPVSGMYLSYSGSYKPCR